MTGRQFETVWARLFLRQLERNGERGRFVPRLARDLFPNVVSDYGEYVFWQTVPAGSLMAFLVAVLSGRLDVPLFPDGLLSKGTTFTLSPAVGAGRVPIRVTTRANSAWPKVRRRTCQGVRPRNPTHRESAMAVVLPPAHTRLPPAGSVAAVSR
ncbi:hypothetical protein ACGF0K_32820 [Streptomyces sp. NPDC048156]|uniref:hypothetical protein n=1 Tax=Streptomyces sp. NPDC048156 TaxID=3365502 RepID=UPI003721D0C0